jgi:hypothetical protein
MSVPVEVVDIGKALTDYGAGYLLTSSEGRIKVVSVEPAMRDTGVLVVRAPGRGTSANIAANSQVTLVFSPLAQRGFTLLVDGTAELDGDDVVVTATGAVLHRPADHAPGT